MLCISIHPSLDFCFGVALSETQAGARNAGPPPPLSISPSSKAWFELFSYGCYGPKTVPRQTPAGRRVAASLRIRGRNWSGISDRKKMVVSETSGSVVATCTR